MKKVLLLVGSYRRKFTDEAARRVKDLLERAGDVEGEVLPLGSLRLGTCRGCKNCFELGEGTCPLKDDRDLVLKKMDACDGLVLASPTYSFQVSGLMKVFLDRLGFLFHRPRFFGKTFTSIVTQGLYGAGKVVKYLDFVGGGLGFNVVKGTGVTTLEPMTPKTQKRMTLALEDLAQRFHDRMMGNPFPPPSFLQLMAFRLGRTSIRRIREETSLDYRYYQDKGWFGSPYYYPVRLGPTRRLVGAFFDDLAERLTRGR